MTKNVVTTIIAAGLVAGCGSSPQQAPMKPMTLRVNVFPGASNLALFAGIDRGIFAKYGLTIELLNTPNSEEQRAGLARGAFEIAHSAIDNAVAMVEMAREEVIIVTGGDGGMNEFIVRPEITKLADIRGKNLVVDAPNTAYALIARKVLKTNGLVDGRDYRLDPAGGTPLRVASMTEKPASAAAMLNPPWSFIAQARGLKSLGRSIDIFGPYQASGAFVLRKWAGNNAEVLERYIAAYVESVRTAMNATNRTAMIALLATRLKLEPAIAERTYETLMIPRFGLSADARFDMEGFRNVLALRAEIEGSWGGQPPAPDRYLGLDYNERALKRIK